MAHQSAWCWRWHKQRRTRIEVIVRWGGEVIHATSLPIARAFGLGERRGDFPFPSSVLGAHSWPLLRPERGTMRLTSPDGRDLGAFEPGASARFELGAFVIELHHAAIEAEGRGFRVGRFGASLSAACGLLCLLAAYLVPPLLDDGPPAWERSTVLRPLVALDAPAEPDPGPPPLDLATEPQPTSDRLPGLGRCGEEEEPGIPVAMTRGRYGISGPKDNPDPHVARAARGPERWVDARRPPSGAAAETEQDANGRGDPNATSMPWGRETSLGVDDRSAQGELFGDTIRDAEGITGVIQIHRDGGVAKALAVAPAFPKDVGGGPRVVHTGLRVDGALAPTRIHALLTPRFAALRACYVAALSDSPRLGGRLDVHLAFDALGAVSAGVPAPLRESPAFTRCVLGALSGLTLPNAPGKTVTAVYPLFLAPGPAAATPAVQARRPREASYTRSPCSSGARSAKSGRASAKLRPCPRAK